MTLKIAQDFEYAGDDFWRWWAWIEGPGDELDGVERVEWLLHPSFNPGVVDSTDRPSGFRIDCSGWGTFVLRARVHQSGGRKVTLRRMLTLWYPDSDQAARLRSAPTKQAPPEDPGAPHRVYLSYGAEDRRRALALRRSLESLGLEVVDESLVDPGEPWDIALRKLQAGADATVAYVSSDTPSTIVAREVNTSARTGKPTLVIASHDFGPMLGVDAGVQVARVSAEDPSGISAALQMLQGGEKAA